MFVDGAGLRGKHSTGHFSLVLILLFKKCRCVRISVIPFQQDEKYLDQSHCWRKNTNNNNRGAGKNNVR